MWGCWILHAVNSVVILCICVAPSSNQLLQLLYFFPIHIFFGFLCIIFCTSANNMVQCHPPGGWQNVPWAGEESDSNPGTTLSQSDALPLSYLSSYSCYILHRCVVPRLIIAVSIQQTCLYLLIVIFYSYILYRCVVPRLIIALIIQQVCLYLFDVIILLKSFRRFPTTAYSKRNCIYEIFTYGFFSSEKPT